MLLVGPPFLLWDLITIINGILDQRLCDPNWHPNAKTWQFLHSFCASALFSNLNKSHIAICLKSAYVLLPILSISSSLSRMKPVVFWVECWNVFRPWMVAEKIFFSSERKGLSCGMRCDYVTSVAYHIPCTLVAAAGAQPRQLPIALHGVTHRPSQPRHLIEPPPTPNMVNGAFRRRESWSNFSPTTRQRQGMGLTLNRPSGLKLLLIWAHYILMSCLAQISAQVNEEECVSVYFHSDLLIVIQ